MSKSKYILKTEPSDYSIDDLEKDGSTVWTGVNNPQAKSFLRSMKVGDVVYIYHTGDQKMIVGEGVVLESGENPRISFVKRCRTTVELSQIKAQKDLEDTRIVRQSRLSVMPVEEKLLDYLIKFI